MIFTFLFFKLDVTINIDSILIFRRVFQYEIPEGKSGQQTVELLQKRAELLGARKTGNWAIDCESYQSLGT